MHFNVDGHCGQKENQTEILNPKKVTNTHEFAGKTADLSFDTTECQLILRQEMARKKKSQKFISNS